MKTKSLLLLLIALIMTSPLMSQDLLETLNAEGSNKKEPVYQTFKGTRIINGQSVEVKGKGELEFIIGHRFGRINQGARDLFGLDNAFIRIGLQYGLTSNLDIGIGRNSYKKIYDAYLKYMMLRQSKGGGSPVTVTLLGTIGDQTYSDPNYVNWIYYSFQGLIARKFSPALSLQLSPTFIHASDVNPLEENVNQFALGFSGRCRITKSIAISGEYYLRPSVPSTTPYNDSIGIGIDIETGGHVFQFVFSNSQGMVDRTFIGQTRDDFFNGDIHFGFNITRTFQLKKS